MAVGRSPVQEAGANQSTIFVQERSATWRRSPPSPAAVVVVVEEIVVGKSATDRVETVRDTVRRTEVEVEDDRTTGTGTAAKPGAPIVPSDPGPSR